MTPGSKAKGCGPEGSKIHFVQTYMLHIKSKVMKSRIRLCKKFAARRWGACLGDIRGKKVGFWVLFFIVTRLPLGFLSKNLESQVIALWMRTGKHIRNFDATPEGRARGCGPEGSKICFVQTLSCYKSNQR